MHVLPFQIQRWSAGSMWRHKFKLIPKSASKDQVISVKVSKDWRIIIIIMAEILSFDKPNKLWWVKSKLFNSYLRPRVIWRNIFTYMYIVEHNLPTYASQYDVQFNNNPLDVRLNFVQYDVISKESDLTFWFKL